MNALPNDSTNPQSAKPDWLEIVKKSVSKLKYGTIVITVHDGRVTQVESIEKTRIVTPPTNS